MYKDFKLFCSLQISGCRSGCRRCLGLLKLPTVRVVKVVMVVIMALIVAKTLAVEMRFKHFRGR